MILKYILLILLPIVTAAISSYITYCIVIKSKKINDKNINENTVGELDKIRYTVVRDAKAEVRSWLKIYGTPIVLILAFFGIMSYWGIVELNKKIMNDVETKISKETNIILDSVKLQVYANIKQIYSKADIETVVDSLIEKDARSIITVKVKEEFQSILSDFNRDQIKYNELLTLHELAINAESGDKISFIRLRNYLAASNPDYEQFSKRVLNKIQMRYYDVSMGYIVGHPASVDTIRKYLRCDITRDRLISINTIMSEEMYEFVPDLISMIPNETDLEVEACIFRTLNKFMDINMDLLEDEAVTKYNKKWTGIRDELMKKRNESNK